ncbi:MAG: polymer-forming cytoskeletal protein [Vitreimonas sp.]
MSETMQTVRRTASQSMTMLKAATGMSGSRTDVSPMPANEPVAAESHPAPTILSENAEMKGSITTTDSVEVRGKLEGDIRAASITVCAGGKVKGDLVADVILIQGQTEGRIQAQDVRLQAGANVSGEIVHGSLGINTAAIFEGTIKRLAATPAATV